MHRHLQAQVLSMAVFAVTALTQSVQGNPISMTKFNSWIALVAAVPLTWSITRCADADVITLDFQSVTPNAGNGTAYLASQGISLTNVTPGASGVVDIFNSSSMYSPGSFWVNENFLGQNGAGAPQLSYTMNFSMPLDSISFTRIATPFNLATDPAWTATAYAGSLAAGSVGESLDSWGFSSPARTFTLTGDGITSLTVSTNGFNFTGIGTVPLDDFVLTTAPATPTPAPSSLTMLLGFACVTSIGMILRRRWQPVLQAESCRSAAL